MIPDNVLNKKLYEEVKEEAKSRFKRYPSAYSSQWIVKTYKERGGKYSGKKNKDGVTRWIQEEWIRVKDYLIYGKKIACGEGEEKKACRPLKRISEKTPQTIPELIKKYGKDKLLEKAIEKEKNMDKRMRW